MGKVIITEYNNRLLLLLMNEQSHPELIRGFSKKPHEDILGNIYIGKITEIVPALEGAFAAVGPDEKVFFSLRENGLPLLVNRVYDGKLRVGDELVLQVVRQALKSKPPGASTKLTLTGQYCVCHLEKNDNAQITYSKRLSREKVSELKEVIDDQKRRISSEHSACCFTIRTNAGMLTDYAPLLLEMQRFNKIFDEIKQVYTHRTCYSCLYRSAPELVKAIMEIPLTAYDEIVTDVSYVYQLLSNEGWNLRLYQDELLPLAKLYSTQAHIDQALGKKVWLPSGGYLVIEPTEAMTVIDVNSGKGSGGRQGKKDGLYLRINLEAAREIARQLRLRNLSGMIMVDFINMDDKKDNKRLLKEFDKWLKEDKINTRLVDMTALGIVEITRKKEYKPLWEQLK